MRRLNALMMVALLVFSTIPMSGIGSVKDPNIYLSEIPEVKIVDGFGPNVCDAVEL